MAYTSFTQQCRVVLLVFAAAAGGIARSHAQQVSGFVPFHRLGLFYQQAVGLDVGLLAYHTRYGYQRRHFYDISFGMESLCSKRFTMAPKINTDAGISSSLFKGATVGGGVDLGWQTDFSSGTWRLTPKVGLTMGSFIRLYYGYHHFLSQPPAHGPIGRHRVSLELNIAAAHDLSIGF